MNGTLTELKQLLPPVQVEYVKKQPSLQDVFFAIVGDDRDASTDTPSYPGFCSSRSRRVSPTPRFRLFLDWKVGLLGVAYVFAMAIYRRRLS